MQLKSVIDLASAERRRVNTAQDPRMHPEITELFIKVRKIIQEQCPEGIKTAQELFLLCEQLDAIIPPPALAEIFQKSRQAVRERIIEGLYDEEKASLRIGQTVQSAELTRRRNLGLLIGDLIAIFKKENPDTIGPKWIQMNCNSLYDRIAGTIRTETGVLNWGLVKEMLPSPWSEKFTAERGPSAEHTLVEQIKQYRDIAATIGPEALAEFLVALDPEGHREFTGTLKIISQYLGRCQVRLPTLNDLPKIPEAALLLAGVRKTIVTQLRNYIYRQLVKGRDDTSDAAQYTLRLDEIERIAKKKLDANKPMHRALLEELIAYYRAVCEIETPANIKPHIEGKDGKPYPFPSLRQRIAMYEMEKEEGKPERNGRRLVAFFMGSGKTGTTFLSKEHVGAKHMLYLCPNGKLARQTADRVKKYYREPAPQVGLITAETPKETIAGELKKEIVITTFTLFSSKVDGKPLTDMIAGEHFDFLAVDEVHNARQEDHRNTEAVYKLATQIPDLYEKGSIMLLSGEPLPNGPDDIVPQLRIFDRTAYGETRSLRALIGRLDPLIVRNAILDFLVLIDEPEDWEKHVERIDFTLSEEEARVYTAILEDEALTPSEKLQKLCLTLLNPRLFGVKETPCTMATRTADLIKEDLKKYDVVFVGENTYKEGVLRKHSDDISLATFVENVKAELPDNVEIYIYDGNTPGDERERIIKRSKESGHKMVIFGMTATMREGIDLSHIHRAIVLEPNYNDPDLAQFVKRFAREGNDDARIRVMMANGTVFDGIHRHARQKAVLCNRLKYSGALTDPDLAFLEGDDLDEKIQIDSGRIVFGTYITDHLLTDREKLGRIFNYLNGKGAAEYQKFIELFGEKFAELFVREWEKTFSANNGRFTAGLMAALERDGIIKTERTADVGCGPCVLTNTIGIQSGRTIDNIDLNPHMLEAGKNIFRRKNPTSHKEPPAIVAAMDHIPSQNESYDVVNIGTALHYTKLNTRQKNASKDERARTLIEQNRILKNNGVLIITMPTTLCSSDEFQKLQKELSNFGFEVLEKFSGVGASEDGEKEKFENYTIVCKKIGAPQIERINLENLKMTRITKTKSGRKAKQKPESPYRGAIHTNFTINNTAVSFTNTATDIEKETLEQYRASVQSAREMLIEFHRENGMTLETLKPDQRTALQNQGVILLKYRTGQTFHWTFTIRENPEEIHPVFPT